MNAFEKIGRWLFPYRYAFDEEKPEPRNYQELMEKKRREKEKREKELAEKKRRSIKADGSSPTAEVTVEDKPVVQVIDHEENAEKLERGELGIEVIEVPSMMTKEDALDRMKMSDSHIAYYYHDAYHHQIAVKFEPDSAWRFYERDDQARKRLKPLLYPKGGQPFDRTHVIPIGFHGSEDDNRLLVGFNSKLNRVDLQNFENKVKDINKKRTVLWYVSIEKQDDGSAKWFAHVWSPEGNTIREQIFHDKDVFVWS